MSSTVSVIIPTYNRAGLIGRAVASARAAILPGDEIIVIDDGSKDDTERVVRALGDGIRYVRIENSGAGAARNAGISLAKGDLLAFLDSDDEWTADKIRLQRAAMDKYPDAALCFTNVVTKFPNGELMHDALSMWRGDQRVGAADARNLGDVLPGVPFSSIAPLPEGREDFTVRVGDVYAALMEVIYATPSATMVRRSLIGDLRFVVGRLMEGWDYFSRVAKRGPAIYLECELTVQHADHGARLTDMGDLKMAATRIALLQSVWGQDVSFLETHGVRYRQLLRVQRLHRARVFIAKGRIKDAKDELSLMTGGSPSSLRLLTMLPPWMIRTLFSVRRSLRGRHQPAQATS